VITCGDCQIYRLRRSIKLLFHPVVIVHLEIIGVGQAPKTAF
jgi:hypothetical protein